jgi:3(or 17)beta-hydroxysteroid dehydrogenase
MPSLAGRTCLVTGAARGIGAAIAGAFVAEGARVILTDIDMPLLEETAARLRQPFRRLDVAREADWAALDIAAPDVVVNNAGITGFDPPAPQDPETCGLETWRRVMAVNLDGCFLGCRWALAAMGPRGTGAIVNIASRSGMVGIPGAVAYAASKAGVRNLTKSVALHAAGRGWTIRCNAVSPAAVLTPMWEPMLGAGAGREERMAGFVADVPLRRFGRAEEVAAAAVWLASDAAAYVTGTEIVVDGGLLAGSAAAPAQATD